MEKRVKWFGFVVAAALLILGTLSGCGNRQLFDTTYTFDRAGWVDYLRNREFMERL